MPSSSSYTLMAHVSLLFTQLFVRLVKVCSQQPNSLWLYPSPAHTTFHTEPTMRMYSLGAGVHGVAHEGALGLHADTLRA